MPEEIFPSSYRCDCGHEFHFSEGTVREAKKMSRRKEIRLGDAAKIHRQAEPVKQAIGYAQWPSRMVWEQQRDISDADYKRIVRRCGNAVRRLR